MRRSAIIILAIAVTFAVVSLSTFATLNTSNANIPPAIAMANNGFTIDIYRQISDGNKNIFFSPTGIFVAFSMLYEGSAGESANQLEQAFGFNADTNQRHSLIRTSLEALNKDDGHTTLEIANSLWLSDTYSVYDTYVNNIRDVYSSLIERVDFVDSATVERINGWVSDRTAGLISDLFPKNSFDEETVLVLANAIYFKGTWKIPFPVENTMPGNFWTDKSTSVTVDMMSVKGMFNYYEHADMKVVELPYEGDRLLMTIALPKGRDNIGNLEQTVSKEILKEWSFNMTNQEIIVKMPKFELSTSQDLVEPLRALGIHDIFETKSDLSNIADASLYVSKAIHDARVNVNEEGTEAAAATAIEAEFVSFPPTFIANHPFLFFIQDKESGAILFMGRMSDPTT